MEKREYNTLHFEFEPFLGASSGAILVGLEARYNFDRPWDIGLNFAGDFNGLRLTAVGDYSFYRAISEVGEKYKRLGKNGEGIV